MQIASEDVTLIMMPWHGTPEAFANPGAPVYKVPDEKELPKNEKKMGLPGGKAPDQFSLEKCPDFKERMTLKNGRDLAVPYPVKGYNCNDEWFH